MSSSAPAIIGPGMDVHEDSITIAVLPEHAKATTRLDRLPNDLPKLKRWLERTAREGELRACYEASGAGDVRHRALRAWGYACEVIAPSLMPTRPGVQRLQCFRGLSVHSAMVLATELVDWRRFDHPRQLACYLGLISREDSGGDRVRLGSITRAGNRHGRHVLVQAAWSNRHRPQVSVDLRRRQAGQPAAVITRAWNAQQRLHQRFQHLAYRKRPQIAVVAVARESIGFLWAVLRDLPGREAQPA